MDVNQIYETMKLILSKNKQQGYFSPADFYYYINQAQRGYLDYLKGEYQRYSASRPVAVVEFGQNQMIRQSLAPLIYQRVLNPNSVTGVIAQPEDLEYTDAMWTYNMSRVKFVQQDRLAAILDNPINPIATNPVYLLKHDGFQFYPKDIGFAELSYIRTPPSIVWAYTTDSNGRFVYDPINSQQPVWAETDIMQIMVRALEMCGVSMQIGAVMQYSQEVKTQGQ